MNIATAERRIEQSLDRLVAWVQRHEYRGYEPADGNSSIFFPLTMGRTLPMRVLQQAVLRAPLNIRPIVGIAPHESSIGRGYMAWSYVVRYRTDRTPAARLEAERCLEWLMVNRAPAYGEFCWGDPYDYATRSGRRPLGEPLLIWSALIGLAFLDAHVAFEEARYLHVAESIGKWIQALPREQTETGCCLSYVAYKQSSIHNSNAMGAAFLARLASLTGDRAARDLAREAMRYTATRQQPDGSWYYAEDPKFHWIDNFHTGYNLSALKTYRAASGDCTFDAQLSKGMEYFRAHFFESDGRPKYFHDRLYPVDIQCAAQAIETLSAWAGEDPECLNEALRVADSTIASMQAADGRFYYRDLGWTKVRTPMLHWGQGTMAKALSLLLERMAITHV